MQYTERTPLYRAYNPGLGRWISRDPLGESAGVNLYGYVGGNPLGFVDPLGLQNAPAEIMMQMTSGMRAQPETGTNMSPISPLDALVGRAVEYIDAQSTTLEAKYLGTIATVASFLMPLTGPGQIAALKIEHFTPEVQALVKQIWKGEKPLCALNEATRQELAALYSQVGARLPAGSPQALFQQARADFLLGQGPNPGPAADLFAKQNGLPWPFKLR